MFERFSQEARQVVVFAQEEARDLNHAFIGTEHILLGLLREEERSGGEQPLGSMGISLEDVRSDVRRIVGAGETPPADQVPFTPRAKKVLELSLREALALGSNWIGPEHILLGIAREDEGVASRVLLDFDCDADKLRQRVTGMLGSRPAPVPGITGHPAGASRMSLDMAWLDGLGEVLMGLSREIRVELGRDPDLGDLLLAIACAQPTLAAQALQEMGIDLDALWGTLERLRQQQAGEDEGRARRIEELRKAKSEALERQEFAAAAELRDEERQLAGRPHSEETLGPEVRQEIRRRLGLAGRGG